MQSNDKNLFLLKSLLYSDFLILNRNIKVNSRLPKTTLSSFSINKKSYIVLEPNEQLKTLKQLIRTLQFLKQQKKPLIELGIKSPELNVFFNSFIKTPNNLLPISVVKRLDSHAIKNNSRALILMDPSFPQTLSSFKSLFDNKFSLITKIDQIKKPNECFYYKIYNDLDNLKKITFFLVLIEQIHKKNTSKRL